MDKITVGVLTVSDSCYKNEATDESGPNLINMIGNGVIKNGSVVKVDLVPDCEEDIKKKLTQWSDGGVDVILTTGGTGISERDVTPEVTVQVCNKVIPGISWQMLTRSTKITPLGSLSRAVAGCRGKSLIINLPGSKKASRECLEAVAGVIPHAVDLITGKKKEIQCVHNSLQEKKSSVQTGNVACTKSKVLYPMIPVKEAQKIMMDRIYLLRKEKVVYYEEAQEYVLAQDLIANDDLPPFDASLKDGYAVRSSSSLGPKSLRLVGSSNAGDSLGDVTVLEDTCVRISTGAAVPPTADAVVQVEDTMFSEIKDREGESTIILNVCPKKGQDIRPKGSDFKMGQMLLTSGTYLDASALGLVAAAGITNMRVYEKPFTAIISTGDELANPHEELKPGKVRDSNRITLLSLLKAENMPAVDFGIVADDPNALRDVLERAFQRADVVVTSGSMSMGERDYLKEVLVSDFKAEICFGRVVLKPGKPTAFAILKFEGKPKLWFGLPGNPASVLVTSHLFLLPALRRISGCDKVFPTEVKALMEHPVVLEDRPQYVRGILTYDQLFGKWKATVIGNQSSSRIGSCVNANCLLLINALADNETASLNTRKRASEGKEFETTIKSPPNWNFGYSNQYMPSKQTMTSPPQNSDIPDPKFLEVTAFLIGKTLRA